MSIPIIKDSEADLIDLFSRLNASLAQKKAGRGRKTKNTVYNTDVVLDSWKFNEWDYKGLIDSEFLPINARGLFTRDEKEIVVRGYDKFFNVDEVPVTKENHIINNTSGPYDVTLKENGCIIFIGGLESGELVCCSKHSTGQRDDLETNHAMVGDAKVREHLKTSNKSARDLALFLHSHNLTAVAELCDDDFEEHVLSYSKEDAGLYLHGLNYNTIKFQTAPVAEVEKFAKEWGFLTVESFRETDPNKLFAFFHESAKSGKYKDREVEGFVVRCKRKDEDFFFKYKFEQPYLLYRQLREVTKQYIRADSVAKIKVNKNKAITLRYLQFVTALFAEHPEMKLEYLKGHGIIKVRQMFLDSIGEGSGMNLLKMEKYLSLDSLTSEMQKLAIRPKKYLIIPVATISCGKTTTFQTLHNLLGWQHIQNDDISRGSKTKLVDRCVQALITDDVVMADRNNAMYRERKQLFDDFGTKGQALDAEFVFICLDFVGDIDKETWWNITFERTKKRGDKHQSIQYDTDAATATRVMKMFMSNYQKVNPQAQPDENFDDVILLDLRGKDATFANVKKIVGQLKEKYPDLIKKEFSDADYKKAFEKALNYVPTFTKDMGKKVSPQYFGIEVDSKAVTSYLNEKQPPQWEQMVTEKRQQSEFHITLGHVASKGEGVKPKWKKLKQQFGQNLKGEKKVVVPYYADVKLGDIVVDKDRLICVKAEIVKVYGEDGKGIDVDPINVHLHATIGTFGNVKPFESNLALEKKDIEVVPGSLSLEKQRVFAFLG